MRNGQSGEEQQTKPLNRVIAYLFEQIEISEGSLRSVDYAGRRILLRVARVRAAI